MAAPSDSATSAVLQALHTLYSDPDTSSKRAANDWLQDFQHSVDAWQTCHSLLTAPDSPLEGRLFAAQTFRAKVLYDFQQLPEEQRFPLRDSLLSALPPLTQPSAPAGSRAVLIQLCLAISALGLQTPSWQNPVGDMIERFGKDPSTVVILLSFLKSWAEESTNSRIAIVDGDTRIGGAVDQVMGVLTMYIQAPGITLQIQTAVFETLRSWLQSGEVMATQVANTPLFPAAFEALSSDQLFDAAVDVLCDLIHETQEIQDNVEVINQIIPRVIALRPQFEAQKEDADAVRGFCRIFCEAGECYHELIARHPSDLLPLVEAVATCAAYPDLDIVPITFNFWYTLATSLGRQPQDPSFRPLLAIFENLQITMINHLHFPSDDESQSAQERDEFRTFRHRMGDTLKDCCHVLGSTTCLRKSYEIITAALSKPSPSWQEIEAPLFSMRSMGAEVDPNDDEVLPHIMDMLPKLPEHPRIRYAAILVLSRYTQWIDRHPENLAFQLQYISAGFEMAQEEVSAAAAQAMKWMCQDCNQHLVPYLNQLHTFVHTMGDKLGREDILEVCEAIGYVIASMPAADAAPALQSFCEPLIQIAQAVADSPSEASKPDLQKVADALEQVDAFLSIVRTLDPLPEACYSTAVSVYSVLDQLLAKYASRYFISERVGTILRRGLAFFPSRALEPLLQPLLSRMSSAFDETGYASYVWITGKTAARFGPDASGPGGEAVGGLLGTAFEGISNGLGRLLQTKISLEIPDVMDDYVHCFNAYLTHLPAYTLSSPALPLAFSHTLMALTCPAPEAILVSLDVLHLLSQRLSHTQFQPTLQPLFAQYGQALVGVILPGIVGQFPEDGLDQAQGVLGATVMCAAPEEVERWAGEGLAATPSNVLPAHDKGVFMRELHEHLVMPGTDRLKNAIINVVRAARRTRERRGQTRKSLGAGM